MAKRKTKKTNLPLRIFALCFIAYIAFYLVSMQIEVAAKRSQLASLNQEIEQQALINAQTVYSLSGISEEKYIEKIARDKLGYAYPDEKIFIDRYGE